MGTNLDTRLRQGDDGAKIPAVACVEILSKETAALMLWTVGVNGL